MAAVTVKLGNVEITEQQLNDLNRQMEKAKIEALDEPLKHGKVYEGRHSGDQYLFLDIARLIESHGPNGCVWYRHGKTYSAARLSKDEKWTKPNPISDTDGRKF